MLQGYADESEQRNDSLYGIAGYIWDDQGAARFDKQWREAINGYRLTEFHMADFESGWGEFKEWTNRTKRLRRLQRLHQIIDSTMLVGLWMTLDLADFAALSTEQQHEYGNSYAACLMVFLGRTARWLTDHDINERVAWVFDEHDGVGRLDDEFQRMMHNPELAKKFRLGSVTWGKSHCVTHLQAADLLAYETVKQISGQQGRHNRPMRKSLANLWHGQVDRYQGAHIAADDLAGKLLAPR